jgi:predicted DNA-binding protein
MEAETKPKKPTTFRLGDEHVEKLDEIRKKTGMTRNTLVGIAIESLLDFAERTGKLPLPKLRKGKRGGGNGNG